MAESSVSGGLGVDLQLSLSPTPTASLFTTEISSLGVAPTVSAGSPDLLVTFGTFGTSTLEGAGTGDSLGGYSHDLVGGSVPGSPDGSAPTIQGGGGLPTDQINVFFGAFDNTGFFHG
jgi:hypothetical protein